MAKIEKLYRRIALVNLSENGEHLIDIPRVQDITSMMVRVTGDLVISVAGATSVPAESPCGLIKSLSFVANGKDVLNQIGGAEAALGNYGRKFNDKTIAPGSTVATHPIEYVAMLDRNNIDGPRPKDSAFQAYLTNLLQLRIVTGAKEDLVVIGGATLALNNCVIEVYVDSVNELEDRGEAKFVKKVTSQSVRFSGSNSNYRFRLPTSNHIRSVMLHATDDGEPSDVLVNDVQVVLDGVDVRHSASWDGTRLQNSFDKEVAVPAGFAVIDAAPSGHLSNCYDLTQADLAECVLDLAAPAGAEGTVELVVEEYIFPRAG